MEGPGRQRMPTRTDWIEYATGEVQVHALVIRLDNDRAYPAVHYQHGRRGLDERMRR